jgi:prepilin-type N-terminal cleavage/methylation domain-containing protein
MRDRRGFSFVELLAVMAIIGLLARIALPRFGEVRTRALAARVVGDFEAVRVAAYDYHAATGQWPREYGAGVVPTELKGSLPSGFTFRRGDWTLDWENWSVATRRADRTGVVLGISVTTTDPMLRQEVIRMLGQGGGVRFTIGQRATFVVQSAGGAL